MPINPRELVNAAEVVAQQQNMKVSLKCSATGGLCVGAAATSGAVFLGPIGLLIGSILGGIGSYTFFRGKFKSLVEIIRQDLTLQQKEQLIFHLQNAVKDFDLTDAIQLATLVMSNEALFLAIASGLKTFVQDELKLQLQSP